MFRPIALFSLFALSGCSETPKPVQSFAIPPAEAFARLRGADMTGFRNGSTCGMLVQFTPHEQAPGAIRWTATSGGLRVAEFTVRLIPAGSGTEARIEVGKGPDGKEMYDGHNDYSHPAMIQPIRPNIVELINAAMEKRAFDVHRVVDPAKPDSLCISLGINFEASGEAYRIDDPALMTPSQAREARANGEVLKVERDPGVVPETTGAWSN